MSNELPPIAAKIASDLRPKPILTPARYCMNLLH